MKTIEFDVSGIPKAQPRPRAFARRMGSQVFVRAYDPGTAEAWKCAIAMAAKPYLAEVPTEANGLKPTSIPVQLGLWFYLPRPKAHWRPDMTLRDWAPEVHTGKPDSDNLAKAVLDALTTLGFWQDDSQVWALRVEKRYAFGNGPGLRVRVVY